MPTHIATTTMEGTRKSRSPKRCTFEVEENLIIMGVRRMGRQWPETLGMEEDCIGSQGPEWTVVLETTMTI
jgi:hypothetical protein